MDYHIRVSRSVGLKIKKFGKPALQGECGFLTIDKAMEAGPLFWYLDEHDVRYSEDVQARCFEENLEHVKMAGMDGVFINEMSGRRDTEYGIMRLDGTKKKAFHVVSEFFRQPGRKSETISYERLDSFGKVEGPAEKGDVMNDYELVNLDQLRGGNVLLGPNVIGEESRTSDIMLGFNRNEHPWSSEMHYHERSKEIYIILKGGLTFRVGEESVQVKANQLLLVKEGVPHDIEDFDLPIEFITIRAPAVDDKVVVR